MHARTALWVRKHRALIRDTVGKEMLIHNVDYDGASLYDGHEHGDEEEG
jgi:hypothetical protein